MLRTFLLALLASLLMPAHADHAGAMSDGPEPSAVNLAGQQRMLSQRIVKAYAQIGLDILPDLARAQMLDAMLRFEANLDALAPHVAAVPDGANAYRNLANTWKALRDSANAPVSRDAALMLSRQSRAVLDEADRLTKLLEEVSTEPGAVAVNHAGRLRMLSQRLAKAYLLLALGIDEPEVRAELDSTATRFAERLAWLSELPENSPDVRIELEEIELQWTWLRTAIDLGNAPSFPLVVVEAAESILEATDHLTRLYEQQNRP